jgi:glycosyltransferase involved in cell wall biosynthesis
VTGPAACVIPALDAAATVAGVARRVRAALPGALVIVVDDGSRDGTADAARPLADVLVSFGANRGKGAALRAGFEAALGCGARAVVTLDADGQHDPTAAPLLLAALHDADVAIGRRGRAGSSMPLGRRLTNALASAAVGAIVGAEVADTQSGFRAIRAEVLRAVAGEGDRYEFETDFLIRAYRSGFRVATVPVPTIYGPRSHFRLWGDSVRIVRTLWRHRAHALA